MHLKIVSRQASNLAGVRKSRDGALIHRDGFRLGIPFFGKLYSIRFQIEG
jgi:hypothetical protein